MGGRGASSGISEKGKVYGTEYSTILSIDNIKFVTKNEGSANAPLETMSAFKNRVYVTVNARGKIKAITTYDELGKRNAEIHLDHKHNGLQPHVHLTYDVKHTDANTMTIKNYSRLVNKVLRIWEEFNG